MAPGSIPAPTPLETAQPQPPVTLPVSPSLSPLPQERAPNRGLMGLLLCSRVLRSSLFSHIVWGSHVDFQGLPNSGRSLLAHCSFLCTQELTQLNAPRPPARPVAMRSFLRFPCLECHPLSLCLPVKILPSVIRGTKPEDMLASMRPSPLPPTSIAWLWVLLILPLPSTECSFHGIYNICSLLAGPQPRNLRSL